MATLEAALTPANGSTIEEKPPSSTPTIEPADLQGTRHTTFALPSPSTIPSAARDPLTPDQETKYTSLLSTVSCWLASPPTPTKEETPAPLSETEQLWLTRECLLRYLRASSWDLPTAIKRIKSTLLWRRSYGVYDKLTPEYISIENETGKQWILGYDNNGRPCLYLNPSRQNTERSDRQIEHLVFMMERCIDLLPPGQETLALLINFAETRNGQGASLAQGRQTVNILQNHYPERLGRALLCNLPWHISAFMRLILPFVDPVTKSKVVFNQPMREHIPPSQLRKSHGGDLEFEYEHSMYWPSLNALARERRESMRERWEAGGKRLGELEGYLKGSTDVGVAGADKVDEKVGLKTEAGSITEQMSNVKLTRDSDEFVDAPEELTSKEKTSTA